MKYEIYSDLSATNDLSVFDFISIGHHGSIPKRIAFMPTKFHGVYNLAFGDITEDGDIDDYSISDNGDRNKILATVVKVVETYTKKYQNRWVYFIGSTEERTRLYRMAVGLHLEELSELFDIYAEVDDEFILFQKNMKMSAFLIKRKKA